MSELAHDLLMMEFLSWIGSRPRTYSETMEAWQSTCPRHTIWEDAVIGGYVQLSRETAERDPEIRLTESGFALLSGKKFHETR